MKKTTLIGALCATLAAIAAVSSCQKQPSAAGGASEETEAGYADVTFSLSDGVSVTATKTVTGEDSEKLIQNVQIFVFRATGDDAGMLEISCSDGFASPLNLSTGSYTTPSPIRCSAGAKDIVVIVNDAADRTASSYGIRTRDQLLSQTSELKDNAKDRLLMTGTLGKTFAEGEQTCSIEVSRLCAAVVLRSVKNAFLSPVYQARGSFRIVETYLLNVPAYQNFNPDTPLHPGVQDASRWYSRQAVDPESAKTALTYDLANGSPAGLNYNETYSTVHTFYSYPNSCSFSEETSWSARATLLVVKAQIRMGSEWKDSYYTVALDRSGLRSNHKYYVDLTVNRPGSDDPNTPVKFSDAATTVTVLPWESGDVYTPEI